MIDLNDIREMVYVPVEVDNFNDKTYENLFKKTNEIINDYGLRYNIAYKSQMNYPIYGEDLIQKFIKFLYPEDMKILNKELKKTDEYNEILKAMPFDPFYSNFNIFHKSPPFHEDFSGLKEYLRDYIDYYNLCIFKISNPSNTTQKLLWQKYGKEIETKIPSHVRSYLCTDSLAKHSISFEEEGSFSFIFIGIPNEQKLVKTVEKAKNKYPSNILTIHDFY